MKIIAKQNGAALVVGMVVLLITTLLGISSMSRTTIELKMASNAQMHNSGFQAAAAALEQVLLDPIVTLVDWDVIDTATVQTAAVTNLTSTQMSATVQYIGCRQVPTGFSLTGAGGSFKGLIHQVTANGQAVNTSGDVLGSSTQALGVQTIRPGC